MRRLPALQWLSLAALAFGPRAYAQTESPLTYRAIREMPPATVARRLLGPLRGEDVVRIETQPNWGMLPGALQVRLLHRPVPVGSQYCGQLRQEIILFTTPPSRDVSDDAALQVQSASEYHTLARASGCRLRQGQQFASLNVDQDVAMRALDELAAAAASAAARRRLPYRLTCRDEVERDANRCEAGVRDALAHMPLDRACSVDADDDDPRIIEVDLCTDGPLWELRLRRAGSAPARLSMLWKDPDPF